MALPNLAITLREAHAQIDRLQHHKVDAERLDAKYQHFIGEMIMLRLFTIFEDSVAELAYKIAAGGKYLNGTSAALIIRASRAQDSRALFLSHGRTKPIYNLKWTKAKYIRESVDNIIPATEKFITTAQAHGQIIEDMRRVRNALAHNTTSARSDFRDVIRQTYGAHINLTPGVFLISTKRTKICLINRYLSSTKAILTAMSSGV